MEQFRCLALILKFYPRDKSASATYYLKEKSANLNDPLWVPYHRPKENEDEFQLRNNQVEYGTLILR